MDTQLELTYHDTVPLEPDKLPKARERAQSQKETILRLFEKYPDRWISPYEMMDIYTQETGKRILITSVRRSITDLTKEFRLIKGGKGEQVDEINGSPNNRWRLNLIDAMRPYHDSITLSYNNIQGAIERDSDNEIEDFNRILNESI